LEATVPAVLLVDDELDHRNLFEHVLSGAGYQVVAAADPAVALGILDVRQVDVAVLDVRLPDAGGIELCRHLRLQPETAELPIMMLSADTASAHIVAAMTAGADDYLAKPVGRLELLTRVGALLGRQPSANITSATAALLAVRAAVPAGAARLPHVVVATSAA
jgi:DNA-binding response OmpR family regulator